MHPYYWESDHGNFGDDLNLWLWDFLLPGFRKVHPEVLLVGVGTVLNEVLLPQDDEESSSSAAASATASCRILPTGTNGTSECPRTADGGAN